MTERALIVVAGEDHAHRLLGQRLTDKALLASARRGWPAEDELDHARTWTGYAEAPDAPEAEQFYRVQSLEDDLRALPGGRPPRTHRINGQNAGHAAWFIDVYALFALRSPAVTALVVIDDADGGRSADADAQRAEAYVRERNADKPADARGPAVAFGVASPAAEGWLLHLCGQPPQRSGGAAKRELRAHLGLNVADVSAPHEHIAEALAPCQPEAATDPDLVRFWRSLCEHVAPAILR